MSNVNSWDLSTTVNHNIYVYVDIRFQLCKVRSCHLGGAHTLVRTLVSTINFPSPAAILYMMIGRLSTKP
jgi:hypothetical protein